MQNYRAYNREGVAEKIGNAPTLYRMLLDKKKTQNVMDLEDT